MQPRCIGCETMLLSGSGPLCIDCHRKLPWWRIVDGCPLCGSPTRDIGPYDHNRDGTAFEGCADCLANGSALHACTTLARYEGPLRRWLPGFKNTRNPFGPAIAIRLAVDHLAILLAKRVAIETTERPDLIVSIPLHPRRARHRGFNHVDPIAHRIAQTLDIPFAPDALVRRQDTPSQARLVGRARRDNIRRAFRMTDRLGKATRVWLIDDILTTGSTLDAAADVLLEAGCTEIRALTLAATLPHGRARRKQAAYHAAASNDRSSGTR